MTRDATPLQNRDAIGTKSKNNKKSMKIKNHNKPKFPTQPSTKNNMEMKAKSGPSTATTSNGTPAKQTKEHWKYPKTDDPQTYIK